MPAFHKVYISSLNLSNEDGINVWKDSKDGCAEVDSEKVSKADIWGGAFNFEGGPDEEQGNINWFEDEEFLFFGSNS